MNRSLRCVAVSLAVLGCATAASAAVVYSTGFEDPPFANNSLLVGQDGWVGVPILSPNAAVVSTDLSAAGTQAVRVHGLDLEHQDDLNTLTGGYYDAIGSYRRPVNYETLGTQIVHIAADVFVAGQQTPAGNNFFSAAVGARTATDDGSTGGTGELAISSDGHVYGYCGCDNVPTFLTSASVTLNAWHNLALDVNPGARKYSFFLDGAPLGTFDFLVPPDPDNPATDYTTVLTRGSLLAYAAPDTDLLKKANYTAYYDNFSITAVPEPTSAVLVLCGIFALFARGGTARTRGSKSVLYRQRQGQRD